MNTILVSYDLHKEYSYDKLYEYFESYNKNHYKLLESTHALYCDKSPKQIRDEIIQIIGKNHSIFVSNCDMSAWHKIDCEPSKFKSRRD